MEELIQQAKNLVATLREKISSVAKQSEELATARSAVEKIKAEQETYAAELAGREVECRKVEDVQELKANATALANDVKLDREKLNGEIEKLTLREKQLNQLKNDLSLEQDLINKGNDLIKKSNAEIKEQKENMRANILE